MITAIEIENFKGIADRVRVEFKPITLLFGANSSGKSTIIHALHYAREVLVRRNLDADRVETGGDFIDLGGFKNFVHGRKPDGYVGIRLDLDMSEVEWPNYFDIDGELDWTDEEVLSSLVVNASVSLKVRWSDRIRRPYVSEYGIDINGSNFGTIFSEPGKPDRSIIVNWEHPLFKDEIHYQINDNEEPLVEEILETLADYGFSAAGRDFSASDAIPLWNRKLVIKTGKDELDDSHVSNDYRYWIDNIVGRSFAKIGATASEVLNDLRYVGPLREKPARNYESPRYPDPGRWPSGIAAWDTMYKSNRQVIEDVSDWLGDESRLATGYSLRMSEYKELDLDNPLVAQLELGRMFDDMDLNDVQAFFKQLPIYRRLHLVDNESGVTLLPQDVGEGISQIIPIVVTLLLPPKSLTAIEQPELHVHPSVQVGLGDLLIKGIEYSKHPILIETHSEHLLLRLLRRIREANDDERFAESDSVLPYQNRTIELDPDQLSVVFMEYTDGGVSAKPLRIDETGEFIDRWPRGFFTERAEELF